MASEESINIIKLEMDGKELQEVQIADKPSEAVNSVPAEIPLKKLPSQEAKEFIEKYGNLKKRNSPLNKSKAKRFDSADYFQARASLKKQQSQV